MKPLRPYIFVFFIATIISSCSVLKDRSARSMEIYGAGVIQRPVVADLKVENYKVVGSFVGKTSDSLERLKNLAIADALDKENADVLIDPSFEVEYQAPQVTVYVSGFPGKYQGFRAIEESDLELIKAGVMQTANVHKATDSGNRKKSNVGLIILGVMLLGGAIALPASGAL